MGHPAYGSAGPPNTAAGMVQAVSFCAQAVVLTRGQSRALGSAHA
jgi:hypothetical protein